MRWSSPRCAQRQAIPTDLLALWPSTLWMDHQDDRLWDSHCSSNGIQASWSNHAGTALRHNWMRCSDSVVCLAQLLPSWRPRRAWKTDVGDISTSWVWAGRSLTCRLCLCNFAVKVQSFPFRCLDLKIETDQGSQHLPGRSNPRVDWGLGAASQYSSQSEPYWIDWLAQRCLHSSQNHPVKARWASQANPAGADIKMLYFSLAGQSPALLWRTWSLWYSPQILHLSELAPCLDSSSYFPSKSVQSLPSSPLCASSGIYQRLPSCAIYL